MGLRLTTKVQVSGWRFLLRRVEHAIVRRDTRMFDDPLQFYGRSTSFGVVVAVLVLVGAAVMAYFRPQGQLDGSGLYADNATFQVYLDMAGRLHPVYNLTSARLILGAAADPSGVASAELAALPRGHWVGIPGAPYTTAVATPASSDWAVCDTVTNPDSVNPVIETAVIMRPLFTDAAIGPTPPDEAILATYLDQDWVVTEQGRHAVDRTDRALTSALGIAPDAAPMPISAGLFNALPDRGPWQVTAIEGAGTPNTLGLPGELVIGSVFQTFARTGPDFWVVLPDGIAPVNDVTAAALRAQESYGLVAPPALQTSDIVTLPERRYASPLPGSPVTVLPRPDSPTVCWTWQGPSNGRLRDSAVIAGRQLPIPASATGTGVVQIQGSATVYTDGGKYLQLQTPDPRYGENLYYVDAQGVRYGLPDAQTAAMLGLTAPVAAPWEIVRLLVDGPVLSRPAALLEHDTLPADPAPRAVEPAGS